ncbi:hypothetical protein Fot_24772 [Forsythia ovata]
MIAKLTAEDAVDLQKMMEESARQRKGKWIDGPSRVVEFYDDGESISPRIHRVNHRLALEKMDLVEGWEEHVREFLGRHEDPDSNPEYWAWNQYHYDLNLSNFTKLRDHYRVPEEIILIFSQQD